MAQRFIDDIFTALDEQTDVVPGTNTVEVIVLSSAKSLAAVHVAVTGQRPADGNDQAGVGVDDHLVIRGVAAVLAGGGHGPVPVGTRVPSTIRTAFCRNCRRG